MNVNIHRILAGHLAIACALAYILPARAVTLFDVTFTGETPGATPNTVPANAGGVSTNATFVSPAEELFGTSVRIQNTYTDSLTGNVFGDGNVLVLNDVSEEVATAVLFQGAAADEISTGVFTVSYDWMQDSGAASSSGFVGMTNQARSTNISNLFLDLGENSGNIRSANNVNFGATLGTAARGVPHHLDWVVDLDQTDFTIATEVYIDGQLLATNQREPLGPPNEGGPAFGNFSLSTAHPGIGTLAYDNIKIQAGRHVMTVALPGDHNGDDIVDAADYVAWRKSPSDFGGDPDGYDDWHDNFGDTLGGGGLSGQPQGVPEPRSVLLLVTALVGLLPCRRGRWKARQFSLKV